MTDPENLPTTGESLPVNDAAAPMAASSDLSLASLWARLKHHKVMQWTLAYAAAAYTLLHGVEMLSDAQEWPHAIVRVFSLVLVLGVPVVITLAWYHGAKGLQKVSGPELTIITILLFIAGSALWSMAGNRGENAVVTGAKDTAASVVAPPPVVAAAPRTSVAIMPFTNLTGDASKDYLGEGMAEELINTLGMVPGLKVPARTPTFAYKGRNADARQIGKDLGVGTILEGSVRSAGDRIRITAQLVNAADGFRIWSESYDRKFADLFKLQDDLAVAIGKALKLQLAGGSPESIVQAPPTQDVVAYQLYLQGKSLGSRFSSQGSPLALPYFEKAVARDPKFARAMALLATLKSGQGQPTAEVSRLVQQAAAIEPDATEVLLAQSELATMRGNYVEMNGYLRAALAHNDNDSDIQLRLARPLALVGHLREAMEHAQKAFELAPTDPSTAAEVAEYYSRLGRETEAQKYAAIAVDLGFRKADRPLSSTLARTAFRAKRYAEYEEYLVGTEQVMDRAAVSALMRRLVEPAERSGSTAADGTVGIEQFRKLGGLGCWFGAQAFAVKQSLDDAYKLVDKCDANYRFTMMVDSWTPELRAFRQDPRFSGWISKYLPLDYWQKYGPPDDCDLKDDKLSCH
jgi:TolB-like protein/Flp pilus assembly protein TadD